MNNLQSLVGQILDGKYNILFKLGEGGMGTVYYAVHLGTKRAVAIKVIIPGLTRRNEFLERFKREAEATGRLRHPNVVDITDFGIAKVNQNYIAYLVMEYLDGCSLAEVLSEEKKLPLSWTIDILEQVCSAIQEAHNHGIIHRDLKPDNIWLEPNQRGGYTAKVLDFGIAKLETTSESQTNQFLPNTFSENQSTQPLHNKNLTISQQDTIADSEKTSIPKPPTSPSIMMDNSAAISLQEFLAKTNKTSKKTSEKESFYAKSTEQITQVGAIMGTPLYMSPEQCRSESLSPISDIYSLGIIAYQMLAGKTPFTGEYLTVLAAHLKDSPPPIRNWKVPRKVKKVIATSLEKEPFKRPHTAEQFAAQMRSASENVFTIFRRSLGIYIENFYKFIAFSLLLYFPTIILGAITFGVSLIEFNNLAPTILTKIVSNIIWVVNVSAGVISETLIKGAIVWIIVQYIDTPLRPFSITNALKALLKKWQPLVWILSLRVVLNLIVQNDYIFPLPLILILSYLESLLFWAVPAIILMENYKGLAILKRNWRLTLNSFWTVLAGIGLSQLLIFIVSGLILVTGANLLAFLAYKFLPSLYELSWDEFSKLISGLLLILVKITNTVLMPIIAAISALIYLKSRNAGGESMKILLDKFKDDNILQSNWQKRSYQRSESLQNMLSKATTLKS